MVKACSKCGEVKPLDEYYRNKDHRDGRYSRCKICKMDTDRRYREANRDYLNRGNLRQLARIQSVTSSASNKCGRWSDAEIAILLADDGRSMISKALELGRTYRSCAGKLHLLRRAGAVV